jgi:hypothetical protein
MNPQLLMDTYYDEAVVRRTARGEFETFVAMPFSDSDNYKANDIFDTILETVRGMNGTDIANKTRSFSDPVRSKDLGDFGHNITDTIVRLIMESNFIIADIRGGNPGVMIELGVAIACRRGYESIVILSQESHADLHFNIRNTNVRPYDIRSLRGILTKALIGMAEIEEESRKRRALQIRRALPVNSITCLVNYAALYENRDLAKRLPSLYYEMSDFCPSGKRAEIPGFTAQPSMNGRFPDDPNSRLYFDAACDTLVRQRLMVYDYGTIVIDGRERLQYGYHLTELGWLVALVSNPMAFERGHSNWSEFAKPALKKKESL